MSPEPIGALCEEGLAEPMAEFDVPVRPALTEIRERSDGFAGHFRAEMSPAARIFEFISVERRRCQIPTCELVLERGQGPVWRGLPGDFRREARGYRPAGGRRAQQRWRARMTEELTLARTGT